MASWPTAVTDTVTTTTAAVPAVLSAAEHLLAETDLLTLLLHRQVLRLRAAALLREDQFRGLYISDEEVDSILRQTSSTSAQPGDASEPMTLQHLAHQIDAASARLSARIRATHNAAVTLPLFRLSSIFNLSAFEQFALLVCVAPELDTRFETLYAYVQNDVTRKRPTPDLILKLFGATVKDSFSIRSLLSPGATLLRIPLIRFAADSQGESSFLSRPLFAEQRIIDFLLQQGDVDERLRSVTSVSKPSRSFSSLRLAEPLAHDLQQLSGLHADQSAIVFLHGPKGCGKRSIAEATSKQQRRLLVMADMERIPSDQLPVPLALQLLQREALLYGANLFLACGDTLSLQDAASHARRKRILDGLSPLGFFVFFSTNLQLSLAETPGNFSSFSFEIPAPDFRQRCGLWADALTAIAGSRNGEVDPAALANKFQLSGGAIQSVCREVAARAMLREDGISLADVEHAARTQSNQGLRRLAQKIHSIYDWSDLILPGRSIQQLREVCASETFRHVVYSSWGYARRLAQGKGLNVLFSGPSGTGKTMAAGIIARALGLDIYKIDLSSVVSKYIGETEKQLSQIFDEAASSNAVLFFDEADALFGKRSEVKDAHDRYANVEVAYLLQKMEEYEGIVILATNFRRNMDDAFTRRMHHIVEFPFPDPDLRERIWKAHIPSDAPLDDDVNFRFLARQFEFSGGNIRNVALAAAFLAAESGGNIRMEHFILSTAREMQKLGRLPARSDFREYYDLLRIQW